MRREKKQFMWLGLGEKPRKFGKKKEKSVE
jgi:hypothetical protein